MTEYSELLPDILPDVPGAPEGLVLRRIRDTAIEFCRETQIWQYCLDPVVIRENVKTYEISGDQPDCTIIDAIREIERFKDMEELRTGKREKRLFPFQDYIVKEDKWTIELIQTPSAGQDGRILAIAVALRPARGATSISTQVVEDWYEGLSHGVKFKLMQIPRKEYTDVTGAAFHEGEYQRAIAKARIEVNRGRMNSNLRNANLRRFTIGGATRSGPKNPERFTI
jgi:hypothetical protein